MQPNALRDLVVHTGGVHGAREDAGLGREQTLRDDLGVTGVAGAAATAAVDHAQVARVHELQVVERAVGDPVDRVVRELVDAGQRQAVEVRRAVRRQVLRVPDLRRRRHVTRDLVRAHRVSAVAGRAQEVVRALERVRVLDSRARVVVRQRGVVARHARLPLRTHRDTRGRAASAAAREQRTQPKRDQRRPPNALLARSLTPTCPDFHDIPPCCGHLLPWSCPVWARRTRGSHSMSDFDRSSCFVRMG